MLKDVTIYMPSMLGSCTCLRPTVKINDVFVSHFGTLELSETWVAPGKLYEVIF